MSFRPTNPLARYLCKIVVALLAVVCLVLPARVCGQVPASVETRLNQLSAEQLHSRLEKALQRPLPASVDASSRWLNFLLDTPPGGAVTVAIHRDSRALRLSGPPLQVRAWQQVIAALDGAAAADDGEVTEVVATKASERARIRRALNVLVAQVSQQEAAGDSSRPPRRQIDGSDRQNDALQQALGDETGGMLGPVQVEAVEGLDVIIIQGSEEDVARVRQIIEQIEQLSAITVPAILVHPLEHVASEALASLLQRVYVDVLGPRVGDVYILPLGKPNALLLIGRTETVQMARELADRLDQPVSPATRFEVFRLKHAPASDVKRLIDDLLAQPELEDQGQLPPALTTRALVVADNRTNAVIVSASPRALAEIAALIERVDTSTTAAVDQVRVFPLRNTQAAELAPVLREAIQAPSAGPAADGTPGQADGNTAARSSALQFLTIDADRQQPIQSGVLTGVRIAADPRANALVVTAPADSMGLIAALIERLDQTPDVEAEIKVFTMQNGDAVSLGNTLRELFGAAVDQDDAGGFGGAQNALVRLQVSIDERTNSIIVAGSKDDLAVVEAILLRLDEGDVRERVTRVYRLKNAFAEDVATALNDWLQTERQVEQEAEVAISPFEQIEREVIIVPEAGSNSLIVSATPRYYEELSRLIDQLDERPPMVMIQVLIAEVSLGDTDEFGVELGLQDSLLFDRSILADTFDTITTTTQTESAGGATISTVTEENIINAPLAPGFNFNNQPLGNNGSSAALSTASAVAAQGLTNFAVNRINGDLNFGGMVLSASSNAVSMLLRALQESRRLEVLSRPQIMTLDGQEGTVVVGEQVPQILGVSLTTFGQTNTIQYRDVGLILRVLPRISPDGLVVMQVQAERSRVGPVSEGIPVSVVNGQPVLAPRIETIQALTTVSALSGQTIVMSGLLTKETRDLHRRVPIISDIPLLGDLFRFDSVSEERNELLIILTPRVVYNKMDAEILKQVESSRMSWVLCDVVTMHGQAGLRSRCDEWYEDEAESIYPTVVPEEGELLPGPTIDPRVQPMSFVAPSRLPPPK